ncbi:MAG: hypothetical protein DI537_14585 [Stutzerimonas stutzeri]|nr:MAG: hypothetical protein DI537_14585 [Stutzerimonas stutzeri]
MTKRILVAGLDGSFAHFGVATAWLDLETLELEPMEFKVIHTEKSKIKTVRSSSDNLRRAVELKEGVHAKLVGVTTAFHEVPSGGQDYNAVLGFGIVIGIYAGLPVPAIEVSPGEAKMAAIGTRTGGKEDMKAWAQATYPNAPWFRHERNGKGYAKGDLTNANEHVADAMAIIGAGIKTPSFKQTLAILRQNAQLLQAA